MKKLAINTFIVLLTISAVAILVRYPEAVLLFLISLSVAAAARPAVDFLTARGFNRGLAVSLTYLALLLVLGGILAAFGGKLLAEIQSLSDSFVLAYDNLWQTWPQGSELQRAIVQRLPPPEDLYRAFTGEQGMLLAQGFLGWTASTLTVVSQFFAALVLSIYWTIDRIYFERLWLSLLKAETRARWRDTGRYIEQDLGAYLRSELIQSLLAGLLLGLGYALIGLKYPVLLALFGAFAWLIPWLGALLAVIPVFISSALYLGWPLAVAAAAYTAGVLLFLENIIEPRLFKRRQYSTWLAILFLMALGDSLGLIGAILAPPLATTVQIIFRRILQSSSPAAIPATGYESARQIAGLGQRVRQVREMVANMSQEPSAQTRNMLDRLDDLVSEADQMIAGNGK